MKAFKLLSLLSFSLIYALKFQELANQVTEEDLKVGRLYPPLSSIQQVSFTIACQVAKCAYEQNLATVLPQPQDMVELVRSNVYDPRYESYIPGTFEYPSVGQYMP